jgi:hypothetical protein
VVKEFGRDHGVIYIEKPEYAVMSALHLIKDDVIKKEGVKAQNFVECNDWQNITDEFERVLEEGI